MEKKINKEESREERTKRLERGCEHESYPSGECLEFNEMCFYEDQTLCPNYAPMYINKNKNDKQRK